MEITGAKAVCDAAFGLGQCDAVSFFNEVEKGGHFATWEEPDLFAGEMRAAFKSLR